MELSTMEPSPSPSPSPKPKKTLNLFTRSASFKEDSYHLSSLKPSEQKSLQDLKTLLNSHPSTNPISIYGVSLSPLDPSDARSDVILLKFLRARDFHVTEAYSMLSRCATWRKEYGTDGLLEEELGFKELEGLVAYMHGWDRAGHPVCYNAYGVFKDKGFYDRVLGEEKKVESFLRWRVQVMERGVKMLQFTAGGVNAMIQVTDLKDMPKRELRGASKMILNVFQDNYPEMVARKIFVNVPWYFSVLYSMISPFLTDRTKSKFVIAREGNLAETLYKYIRPEFVPVQYGGLSRPADLDNGPPKPASEFSIKGGEKVFLEIDGIEAGATITWDLVVGGWDLEYGAEFIPVLETSYTLSVEKPHKIQSTCEEPVHNSFTARETGKMVLSIDNSSSRKKKVAAYRYFVRKPSA